MQGVPTVTLVGETVVGRAGLCQAMNVGLPELIATTPEEFVRAVSSLASELEQRPGFARNLESAYRDAWRRFRARN